MDASAIAAILGVEANQIFDTRDDNDCKVSTVWQPPWESGFGRDRSAWCLSLGSRCRAVLTVAGVANLGSGTRHCVITADTADSVTLMGGTLMGATVHGIFATVHVNKLHFRSQQCWWVCLIRANAEYWVGAWSGRVWWYHWLSR